MSATKLVKESYSPWFQGVCSVACGWRGAAASNRAFVLRGVKEHARDTGHETAIVRDSSVHYRRIATIRDEWTAGSQG
jgi:predicted small metal-binding protein